MLTVEQEFTWPGGEQEFFHEEGFTDPPKRCQERKQARKVDLEQGRRQAVKQNSFRIYRLDGQPLDLELQEITNIVIRGNIGTVRYGFNYLDLGAEQAEVLADAWAAFLLESRKGDQ